ITPTPTPTPTPTTTPTPTPEPEPVVEEPEPEPEPVKEDPPASPPVENKGGAGTYKGEVTYYNPGVGLGSCGFHSADSSFTVAVSATLLAKYDVDSNPNHNK